MDNSSINNYSGPVTITDAPTVAQLVTINVATSGDITLQVTDGALSGSADDLVSAFAGNITPYTGPVTITNAPDLAKLTTINTATSGSITFTDNFNDTSLSGTAADLAAAFAGTITNYAGNVTITDAPTVAQLVTINAATSGAITLEDATGALSGSADDLVLAFAGTVTEHTGTVTITNTSDTTLSASDIKTINDATSGTVTLSGSSNTLVGSTSDMLYILVSNPVTLSNSTDITLSDNADTNLGAGNIKSINDLGNVGTVTLTNAQNITGSFAECKSIVNTIPVTSIEASTFTLNDTNLLVGDFPTLNTFIAAVTPAITANVSGVQSDIVTISTGQRLTITVTDEVTVAEGTAVLANTELTAPGSVQFSEGITDTFSNMRNGNTILASLSNMMTIDADVNLKMVDSDGVVDTISLTEIKAAAFLAIETVNNYTGTITANIIGSLTDIVTALGNISSIDTHNMGVSIYSNTPLTTRGHIDLLVDLIQSSTKKITADIDANGLTYDELYNTSDGLSGLVALLVQDDAPTSFNDITMSATVNNYDESAMSANLEAAFIKMNGPLANNGGKLVWNASTGLASIN